MPAPWRTSLVIGNPGNRRVQMWQTALRGSGRVDSVEVSYADLLRGRVDLPPLLQQADVVRLDSPGETVDVERLLILRGAQCTGRDDVCSEMLTAALTDRGRIVHPGLWAVGYRDLLADLQRHREASPSHTHSSFGCRWLSDPGEVHLMFDKPACQRQLADAGIPVPQPLPLVHSYEDLRSLIREANCSRMFVKLPGGSSASGVVALNASSRRIRAVTSVEVVHDDEGLRLYNSLRVRTYNDEPLVATLIDALAAEGPLHVEEWVPKASLDGRTFDLRIVVIGGEPQHVVVRTSRGPLTNLHLGNRRGDAAALRRTVPDKTWQELLQTCRQIAGLFPGCLMLGIDLGLTPGFRRHFVIEVNAFGDLLPDILYEGRDTYAAQVAAIDQAHTLPVGRTSKSVRPVPRRC